MPADRGRGSSVALPSNLDAAATPANEILSEEFAIENDAAVVEIGDARLERDQRFAPIGQLDLEQVAGAVIFDRCNRPDSRPFQIDARQADDVGVIIFALAKRGQRRAVDFDQRTTQCLGRAAVGNSVEARYRHFAVANRNKPALDPRDVEFLGPAQAFDTGAEQLQPHLALDAMRPGDRGERNTALVTIAGTGQLLGLLFGFGLGRITGWRGHLIGALSRSLGRLALIGGFIDGSGLFDSLFGRGLAGVRLGSDFFL